MPGPSPGFALFLAILLLGVCSQIVQPLLIRESLVVFYGNEVSLGGPFSAAGCSGSPSAPGPSCG